jgi:hypothetical protein
MVYMITQGGDQEDKASTLLSLQRNHSALEQLVVISMQDRKRKIKRGRGISISTFSPPASP